MTKFYLKRNQNSKPLQLYLNQDNNDLNTIYRKTNNLNPDFVKLFKDISKDLHNVQTIQMELATYHSPEKTRNTQSNQTKPEHQ